MIDASVQRMMDELEIRRTIARLCRAVDRMDMELMRSCFHPDATFGEGHEGGVEAFIEYCRSGRAPYVSTTHFIGNQLIEIDGETAWAETYVRAAHRLPGEGGQLPKERIAHGRYVDRVEKRDGEWRIARRLMLIDSDRVDTVTEHWIPESQINGRRDRSDPSYRC